MLGNVGDGELNCDPGLPNGAITLNVEFTVFDGDTSVGIDATVEGRGTIGSPVQS
jgi:hypothetical protein